MPKRKVAVALSEWLVDEIDEVADFQHRSRSSLVEEALTAYVVRQRVHKDDEEYQAQAWAAMEDMKRIADEYAADPANADAPSSLEILRMLRADWPGAGK